MNNRIGDVADVVLNLGGDRADMTTGQDTGPLSVRWVGNAEVLYLVVDLDDDVVQDDAQGNLVMIPWQSVRSVDDENNVVVVNVDVMQLGQAPRFGDDEWPEFTTEDWDEQVRDFWGDVTGNRTNP
jgi:hypothetical protein